MSKRIKPPICPYCDKPARLTTGPEIYAHRKDLATKNFWICDSGCNAWCGCHPGTRRPLGMPANAELRRARSILHEKMIDPLWRHADTEDAYDRIEWNDKRSQIIVRNKARSRVYLFLAAQMGISPEECHTGMFDLQRCRDAWVALRGVTYATIRTWAKMRESPKENSVDRKKVS